MNAVPVLIRSQTGQLRIWDPPKDGVEYVVGADVSEGKVRDRSAVQRRTNINYGDSRPDYSAAVVLELITGLHVASWHGYLSPDLYAGVLAAIGAHYNNALLVPESNGPGVSVISRLTETIGYDNMYVGRLWNVIDLDPNKKQFGFQTNASSRKQLMMHVHSALNSNQLFTRDADLIDELRTMEFDEAGVERARGKNKDDRVLALALALEGRYSSGQNIQSGGGSARQTPEQSYQDQVWAQVRQQQEQLNDRNSRRRRRHDPRWRGAMGPRGRR